MEIDLENGNVLLIDKPLRWTSFDVVKKVRNIIKIKKVGHAGTLDPLATGLLIVCTGRKTKEIEKYQAAEKEYTGTILLGITTPSFDMELPANERFPFDHVTKSDVENAAAQLTGTILQTPPLHSAIRINGKRAYHLARKGKDVTPKPREVTIKIFEINSFNPPVVGFRVVCSKGTYIRSLANDLGGMLNSGACLESLCRTRIGDFQLDNALTLDSLASQVAQGTPPENI